MLEIQGPWVGRMCYLGMSGDRRGLDQEVMHLLMHLMKQEGRFEDENSKADRSRLSRSVQPAERAIGGQVKPGRAYLSG